MKLAKGWQERRNASGHQHLDVRALGAQTSHTHTHEFSAQNRDKEWVQAVLATHASSSRAKFQPLSSHMQLTTRPSVRALEKPDATHPLLVLRPLRDGETILLANFLNLFPRSAGSHPSCSDGFKTRCDAAQGVGSARRELMIQQFYTSSSLGAEHLFLEVSWPPLSVIFIMPSIAVTSICRSPQC